MVRMYAETSGTVPFWQTQVYWRVGYRTVSHGVRIHVTTYRIALVLSCCTTTDEGTLILLSQTPLDWFISWLFQQSSSHSHLSVWVVLARLKAAVADGGIDWLTVLAIATLLDCATAPTAIKAGKKNLAVYMLDSRGLCCMLMFAD